MNNVEVVAAVIVRDTKVLLVRSKKHGACVTPGGRVEPGETHEAALVREVQEETGLTVTSVGKRLGTEQRGVFAVHFYCAEVAPGEPVAGDDAADAWWGHPRESKDHLWALEGLVEHLHGQIVRNPILAAMEALKPLAARAYRSITQCEGDPPEHLDEPIRPDYDVEDPRIVLALHLGGVAGPPWQASVEYEGDMGSIPVDAGNHATGPLEALDELRASLEAPEEGDEADDATEAFQ